MKNRIRELRKAMGLSQHRLAKKVGVTRFAIMDIETEKSEPRLRLAHNIAKALNADLYEVFQPDEK